MVKSRIKELRLQLRITQEDLARICNFTTRTIQNLEKSTPEYIINILKIKKALNCNTIDELFDDNCK